MPDDFDRAAEHEQLQLALSLKAQATAKPDAPEASGRCLFCGEPQQDLLRRWCDADCRNLWERERRAKDRNRPVVEPE